MAAKDITRANPNKPTKAQRAMLEYLAENPGTYPSRLNMRVYRALFFANPALVETRKDDNFMHRVYITHAGAKAIGRTDAYTATGTADAQPATEPAQAFGINDKVVIRKDAEQDTEDLIEYQSARMSGTVMYVDEHGIVVSFRGDKWRLTADELELWKPAEADAAIGGGYDGVFQSNRTWTAAELAQYSEDNPYPPHKPGATADETLASYEYEIAALKKLLSDTVIERDTGDAERKRLRAALAPFAIIGSILRTMPQPHTAWNCYISGHPGKAITLQDVYAAWEALAETVAQKDGGE